MAGYDGCSLTEEVSNDVILQRGGVLYLRLKMVDAVEQFLGDDNENENQEHRAHKASPEIHGDFSIFSLCFSVTTPCNSG